MFFFFNCTVETHFNILDIIVNIIIYYLSERVNV